jgi:hypothetical protein
MSMKTSYGGGQHGHLGMLMPYNRYWALSRTPYTLSDSAPTFIDPSDQSAANLAWWKPWTWFRSSTTHTRAYNDAKIKFDKATADWEAAHEFKRTMQKVLIKAVPAMFLTTFHKSEYGYADMEPGAVLEQLIQRYGTITRKEMAANLEKLKLPWNPDMPIESVFTNAEECQAFAGDGDEPIPEGQYIGALEQTFKNSGVLEQAVSQLCFLAATAPKHIVYSDQTGRLPQASASGNQYLLVVYDHDSNFIFMQPIQSRKSQYLLKAIQDIYKILSRSGFPPKFHRLPG